MARSTLGHKALSVLVAATMVVSLNAPVSAWADSDSNGTATATEELQTENPSGGGFEEIASEEADGIAAQAVPVATQAADEVEAATGASGEDAEAEAGNGDSSEDAVATLGSQPYTSIDDAIDAWATEGGKLVLEGDATYSKTVNATASKSKITIKVNAELDLAGHSLSLGGNYLEIAGSSVFKLSNDGDEGSLTSSGTCSVVKIASSNASFEMNGGAITGEKVGSNGSLWVNAGKANILSGSVDTVKLAANTSLDFGSNESNDEPSITKSLALTSGVTSNFYSGFVKALSGSSAKLSSVTGIVRFGSDPSSYLSANKKAIKGDDDTYTVGELSPDDSDTAVTLTKVDGTTNAYVNAKDAFTDFQTSSGVLQLRSDQTYSSQITVKSSDSAIDLNGNTLTLSFNSTGKSALSVNTGAKLIVRDSSESGAGRIVSGSAKSILADVKGELSLKSGALANDIASKYAVVTVSAATAVLNVEGGKVSRTNGTSAGAVSVTGGTVNVSSGVIEADNGKAAVSVSGANAQVNMTGGTVTSDGAGINLGYSSATVNLQAGIVSSVIAGFGTLEVGKSDGKASDLTVDSLSLNSSTSMPTVKLNSGTVKTFISKESGSFTFSSDSAFSSALLLGDETFGSYLPGGWKLSKVDGGYKVVSDTLDVAVEVTSTNGNTRQYASMAEAFAKFSSGDTFMLLKDVDLSSNAGLSIVGTSSESFAEMAIDLNGHDLKVANKDGSNIDVHYATLTIKDTSEGQNGRIWTDSALESSAGCPMIKVRGGKLVVDGGTIDAATAFDQSADGQYAIGVYYYGVPGEVVVNGGSIVAGQFCIAGNGSKDDNPVNDKQSASTSVVINGGLLESKADYAIYNPQIGTVDINGGIVKGAAGGVMMKRGTLNVTGGTISTGGVKAADSGDGTGSSNADPSAVAIDSAYGEVTVKISGGSFEAAEGGKAFTVVESTNASDVAVSGGTFADEIPEDYCANGFVPVKNADGTYGVEYKPVQVWTGYNGSKVESYSSIDEAVENLGGNEWIVVGSDYTLTTNFTIPEGVYLDVAANATLTVSEDVTLTVADNAKRLGVRSGATLVNNGTVMVCGTSVASGKVMVQNGGVLDANTLSVPEGYVLENNGTNYYAAKPVYQITYSNGTVKQAGSLSNLAGATKVTLLEDIEDFARTFSAADKLADGFVLDLGGHTLSGKATASTQVLKISVPMTIQNGTIKYASSNTDYGALQVSANVTVANSAVIDGGLGYGVWTDGYGNTLTVNGKVHTNGACAITSNGAESGGNVAECNIAVNGSAEIAAPNGVAIYHPEKGTVTVNGGTVTGHTGIEMCAGKLIVNNGSVIANGADTSDGGNVVLNGAAIAILNRNYPGGTPYAEIKGGSFSSEASSAVQAYTWLSSSKAEWEDVSSYVDISGGAFSGIPDNMAELCAKGYTAVPKGDGYEVVEGKYTVQVTSRTTASENPVANVAGGGSDITCARGTTVTASAVSGYKFVGWYLDAYTEDAAPYSAEMTCEVKPTSDCTMIAVYEPVSGAKFWLDVTASEFTVNGGATQDSYLHEQYGIGEQVTVEFTGSENFLYWVNASNKVVSFAKSYTFTMGSETSLKAVYGKERQGQATVVFVSASAQIVSSKAYTSSDAIQFPVPPIKMGCTFTGWSMTQDEIQAAMADAKNGIIEVRAQYTEPSTPFVVTVVYPEGTDVETVNGKVGQAIDITAKNIEGKTFSYWTDAEGNVLGYTKTLKLAPSGDITVEAVYDAAEEAKPVITMTAVDASVGDGCYIVSFTATRSVPEGYELVKQGILYSVDARCSGADADDYLKLTASGAAPDGVYEYAGNSTTPSGVTRYNQPVQTADTILYGRGYMILKNSAGELSYVYADAISSGSYNSLNK